MLGVMFQSFATACTNLRIVLGSEASELMDGIQPMGWYPLARYYRLAELVIAGYTEPVSILQRIGTDTAKIWYDSGIGKAQMSCGVDFLKIQTGRGGYHSIIRGPADVIGTIELQLLDEANGRARVHSTTLTPRELEKGVLHGGLQVMGDITFVQIENVRDPDIFEIEFH